MGRLFAFRFERNDRSKQKSTISISGGEQSVHQPDHGHGHLGLHPPDPQQDGGGGADLLQGDAQLQHGEGEMVVRRRLQLQLDKGAAVAVGGHRSDSTHSLGSYQSVSFSNSPIRGHYCNWECVGGEGTPRCRVHLISVRTSFPLRYRLLMTNGRKEDLLHYHFSADEMYILPILVC